MCKHFKCDKDEWRQPLFDGLCEVLLCDGWLYGSSHQQQYHDALKHLSLLIAKNVAIKGIEDAME